VTNKNIIVDDELAQKGRCFGVVIPSCDQWNALSATERRILDLSNINR
jgi:hypothetical protein